MTNVKEMWGSELAGVIGWAIDTLEDRKWGLHPGTKAELEEAARRLMEQDRTAHLTRNAD